MKTDISLSIFLKVVELTIEELFLNQSVPSCSEIDDQSDSPKSKRIITKKKKPTTATKRTSSLLILITHVYNTSNFYLKKDSDKEEKEDHDIETMYFQKLKMILDKEKKLWFTNQNPNLLEMTKYFDIDGERFYLKHDFEDLLI